MSNIIKLQSQFQRFLYQTLSVFSQIKDIKHISNWIFPGVGIGCAGGQKFLRGDLRWRPIDCAFLVRFRHIAHTVSHFSYAPLFQNPYFLQKCWNQIFSMIIYLLTFYLFVDIKNIFRITHANNSAASKAIFLTLTKMHMQPERLYFLRVF